MIIRSGSIQVQGPERLRRAVPKWFPPSRFKGAGPLFDMGPYYLTALVQIFGPVATVAAVGSTAHATRTVQVGDRLGASFPVEVSTHVSAIAQFASGGVSQSLFSFQSRLAKMGVVEITGTEGTLIVPDPNRFTGEVKLTRAGGFTAMGQDPDWEVVPVTGTLAGRGIGVLDMARSIRSDSQHLASGELGYHVLDILVSIDEAIESRSTVAITSTVEAIPFLSEDWNPFESTL
jgi:predicted dehydrogenase